jgi:hypothetical protein
MLPQRAFVETFTNGEGDTATGRLEEGRALTCRVDEARLDEAWGVVQVPKAELHPLPQYAEEDPLCHVRQHSLVILKESFTNIHCASSSFLKPVSHIS